MKHKEFIRHPCLHPYLKSNSESWVVLKDEVLGWQDALPACHLLSVLLSTGTVFNYSFGSQSLCSSHHV